MEGENHYTRAEDACHRAEMASSEAPREEVALDALLAVAHAQLAVADQLALVRAAVERLGLAQPQQVGRPVVDVPLPESDGACSECGIPELLGHKLSCSRARG